MKALGQTREIDKLLDKEGIPKYSGSMAVVDRVARLIYEQQIKLHAAREAAQVNGLLQCSKMIVNTKPLQKPSLWAITSTAHWNLKQYLLSAIKHAINQANSTDVETVKPTS